MRLNGYCDKCRKIKMVRVTASSQARGMRYGATVPFGICANCEETEQDRQKERQKWLDTSS